MQAAEMGQNWVKLASVLGVAYKTAWHWINAGRSTASPKGGVAGNKPKKINEEILEIIISWIEINPQISLQEIAVRVEKQFGIQLARSCVGNYLNGMLYISRLVQVPSELINTPDNKFKRAEFVTDLLTFTQMGKDIMWVDEINFNLYSLPRNPNKRPTDAAQNLCNSRQMSLHLVGALSSSGTVAMNCLKSIDKEEDYNSYINILLSRWHEMGHPFKNLLIICDKTFSYNAIESDVAKITNSKAKVMRLDAYTPMLNPMETIWSKMKNYVKAHLSMQQPTESSEHRLQQLEQYINEAWASTTLVDCTHAIEFSTSFHADALSMRDMHVVKL